MRWLLFLAMALAAYPQSRTLFRNPTVNRTQVVFSYADDLWTVPRAGGEAVRLTSGLGTEAAPIFSPDGTQVAFTATYEGNVDVYVVPAKGGVPKRLTYHPDADIAQGWTPDSQRVLFSNTGGTPNDKPRLYTVDLGGGFPSELPLPIAAAGSYSADGKQIAYLPFARANLIWKNYRGGRATPIWIANLSDSSITKVPHAGSNDHSPLWIGDKIYFLSDRNGSDTLFAYDTGSKAVTQLVENKGLDFKSATAGPDAIAYEQFGEIYLYDLKTKKPAKVNITLSADLLNVRPRLEKLARSITNWNISPTGARAVAEARGEIFTIPAEKGDVRNLTASSGVADRDPAWSPDGKLIAYFSDESGEYALHLRDQTGRGDVTKISLGETPSFFYSLQWSPDSKQLTFTDKRLNLWRVELASKQVKLVDKGLFNGDQNVFRARWSPDNKWIAYAKSMPNQLSAIFIYSVETGQTKRITDGLSDAGFPVWDKGGKYLYFASSTDSGPSSEFDLSSAYRASSSSLYLAVLSKTEPSPFSPESDEEKPAPAEGKKEEPKKEESKAVKIDFDGIDQRIVPLPLPARNYRGLEAGKAGTLFYFEAPATFGFTPGNPLQKFDLSKRKADLFAAGVTAFRLSANGEKILIGLPGGVAAIVATAAPMKPGDGLLKLDGVEAFIDPRAEWKQMYKEAWRIERDFFYDTKYHGLDLQAANERYSLYLNSLGSRSDLTYLFQEMLGQMSVGHLYIGGGDQPNQPKPVNGGLLGADYIIQQGRYRLARVYSGENWNPQTRAPLTQPGVGAQAGEFLLAVNGRELTGSDNIYSFFEGMAGKRVLLKLGPNANGEGSREVTVIPVDSETSLRTLAWVEENRQAVDKLSGGKLAYIHMPDTAGGGYTYFNRYFYAQTDKQGVVLDGRFNRGGSATEYVIERLQRKLSSLWASRDGAVTTTPSSGIFGPKVMVVNEYSGSGGDLLPWLFKRAKLGPVVGKRTWGGLVGIGGYPTLLDGGSVTAPHFGFWSPEGKWEVENHGTPVDVEVDLDPKAWREGHDPQLERAVELAMAELKKNPPPTPVRPAFPDYHTGKPTGRPANGARAGGSN
ncbi:MAG: PDZ domain-containing protein [Bryobacteraceae bacterium]|nr:PDZ domain-containing protein [Bryobacteraceae bacterium]